MRIAASPDHVVEDIGEKKMAALRKAVDGGGDDFAEYRAAHPLWAAQDSGRTTHNWIHERIWHRVVAMAETFPDVDYVESMPTRELYLGTQYRIRFKKHTPAGAVASYPTPTALSFYDEPLATLPSLEVVNLTVGFEWDEELRELGRPVMCLHSAMDKALWMIELPGDGEAGTLGVLRGPVDGPLLPTINVPGPAERTQEG